MKIPFRCAVMAIVWLVMQGHAHLSAQHSAQDTAHFPYWLQMMQEPIPDFYKAVRAYELYYSVNPKVPHSGYKQFERWRAWQQEFLDSAGIPLPGDHNLRALQEYRRLQAIKPMSTLYQGEWTELGPKKIPVYKTNYPIGIGRINGFALHKQDSNKLLIGAPRGGAWKSEDHGQNWHCMTDDIPGLGVSTLVWDYSDDKIILLGSGDRDYIDAPGLGIFKSSDGGNTWVQHPTAMVNSKVFTIIQNPLNPQVMIASSTAGIYYSANKGENWKEVYGGIGLKDIRYKPGDTTIVYGCYGANFMRSKDGGQTWENRSWAGNSGLPLPPSLGRIVIGVSEQFPSYVYITTASVNFKGFYLSTDNGETFRLKSVSPDILEGQTHYNMCMVPLNDSGHIVYVGGINLWVSRDTGATWRMAGDWSGFTSAPKLHADHHWIEQHPVTGRIIVGNDGGLFSRNNNGSWHSLNGNLGISQIYKIGQSNLRAGRVVAGYQDNGTGIYDIYFGSNPWTNHIGADGMECIFNPVDSNVWYGCMQNGRVVRNGNQFLNMPSDYYPWITPYLLHPSDANTMFVAGRNLWRNRKMNGAIASGWEQLTTGISGLGYKLHINHANPNMLFFIRGGQTILKTSNCLATIPKFDTIIVPSVWRNPGEIVTSWHDSNTIFTISNNEHVIVSRDLGKTWSSYSQGLPHASLLCLAVDKYARQGLYCGTANGVFYRDSLMDEWVPFSSGLQLNAHITEMEIYYDRENTKASRISAGTYGRGLWQSPLFMHATSPEVDFSVADSQVCLGNTLILEDRSQGSVDSWLWTITPSGFAFVNGTTAHSRNPEIMFNQSNSYSVSLRVSRAGQGYGTVKKKDFITVINMPPLQLTAATDSICSGQGTIAVLSGGSGAYFWSPDSGIIDRGSGVFYVNPEKSTLYKIASNNDVCFDSAAYLLHVVNRPRVHITGRDSCCLGDTLLLKVQGAGRYHWFAPGGLQANTDSTLIIHPRHSGRYTVHGSNGFCADTAGFDVRVMEPITAEIFGPSRICAGEMHLLEVFGGAIHQWFPHSEIMVNDSNKAHVKPASGLHTFNVIVHADGFCADTLSHHLTVDPPINASVSLTSGKICFGDSIALLAGGGSDYFWKPDIGLSQANAQAVMASPAFKRTYTVIVNRDSLCSDSAFVTIDVAERPGKIPVDLISACAGDTAVFDAGNEGMEVSWSNGETGRYMRTSVQGTYRVMVTNAPCIMHDSVVLMLIQPKVPTITRMNNVFLSSSASKYQWYRNGRALAGEEKQVFSAIEHGWYAVRVLDSNGCEAWSDSIAFESPNEILQLFPNPASGTITLRIPENMQVVALRIEDFLGRNVINLAEIKGPEVTMTLSQLSSGTYNLKVFDIQGKVYNLKLVKL
jgi:PKD repeat protein